MAGVNHRLQPGSRPALRERYSDGKEYHDDRDLAEVEFRGLRQELVAWQKRLYAEGKQRLLVVCKPWTPAARTAPSGTYLRA